VFIKQVCRVTRLPVLPHLRVLTAPTTCQQCSVLTIAYSDCFGRRLFLTFIILSVIKHVVQWLCRFVDVVNNTYVVRCFERIFALSFKVPAMTVLPKVYFRGLTQL